LLVTATESYYDARIHEYKITFHVIYTSEPTGVRDSDISKWHSIDAPYRKMHLKLYIIY